MPPGILFYGQGVKNQSFAPEKQKKDLLSAKCGGKMI